MGGNYMSQCTDIAAKSQGDGTSLMALVERAMLDPTFDVEKMRAVLELKKGWDKDRAAEAYAAALTTFQAKCPTIHKTRTAKITGRGDNTGYSYGFASYDDVMREIGPLLTECGLALSFSTANQEKGIRVTLRIRHGTHCEEHTLDVPVPQMSVNDTQRYGAALSYAKRYALCAALNIVTTNEDDDASGAGDPITDRQALELEAFMQEHDLPLAGFLKYMEVDRIADIPATDLGDAWSALQKKVKDRQNANR